MNVTMRLQNVWICICRLKQLNSLCHYLVKRAAEVLGSFKNSLALFLNPVFAMCRISIDRHELDDGQDCEGLDG